MWADRRWVEHFDRTAALGAEDAIAFLSGLRGRRIERGFVGFGYVLSAIHREVGEFVGELVLVTQVVLDARGFKLADVLLRFFEEHLHVGMFHFVLAGHLADNQFAVAADEDFCGAQALGFVHGRDECAVFGDVVGGAADETSERDEGRSVLGADDDTDACGTWVSPASSIEFKCERFVHGSWYCCTRDAWDGQTTGDAMDVISEAIFAVSDVRQTVRFYREVLGFESEWLWEDPPTFGGVRWGKAQIMFCLQPDLAEKVVGHQHFLRVDDADALHAKHLAAGAAIVSPIENKPWGGREYTVRDPNGYHLRFMGPAKYERPKTATEALLPHIRIELRVVTLEEFIALHQAVGWIYQPSILESALQKTHSGATAVDTRDETAVGMLRVCGDGKAFTIWDVIVKPSHQGQKIGSAMIAVALAELRKSAPRGTFVGLFTGKPEFYERLGFCDGHGMHLPL
jgi:predicted enzyme related to lactoylglutathione lyase/GNAT superfamily N-acetyltransferase